MATHSLPENYSYSEDHEWIDATAEAAVGTTVKVGITSVATERLGEVVYAELPQVGDAVTAGEPCGEVESTKSVSDLYAPVSGEITAVNELLDATPELVNSDPYGDRCPICSHRSRARSPRSTTRSTTTTP